MSQFMANVTSVLVQDGQIYAQTFAGNQLIGVTIEKYREMEKLATDAADKAEGFRKQLVDAGIIKPKLSAEEQIAALSEQVANLAGALTLQNKKVNELTELLTAPDPFRQKEAER